MKKLFMLLFFIISASAFAGQGYCDLQVTGLMSETEDYKAQVKSVLASKGYTNIRFIKRNEDFIKLVLHFDTETPGFNFSQISQIVLADETIGTYDKYLFVLKKKSYRLGSSKTYLKLLQDLPSCH